VNEQQHSQLCFSPRITLTAEHVAEVLGCGLEKADQILSRSDARQIIERVIDQAMHEALDKALYEMARAPLEAFPVRRDCVVKAIGMDLTLGTGSI
jgi:hypothetical protein